MQTMRPKVHLSPSGSRRSAAISTPTWIAKDCGACWPPLPCAQAHEQARKERAQKRGGGKVLGEGDLPATSEGPLPLDQLLSQISTQEFDLITEELLLALNPELREIAVLRLMGHSNKEIAEQLGCTQRKSGASWSYCGCAGLPLEILDLKSRI